MNTVLVYTTAACPYCVAAKQFLQRKGFAYDEVRVDLDAARRAEMLERSGGRRTVPQIFFGETHVGGYDDLVAADRGGRLPALAGGAP